MEIDGSHRLFLIAGTAFFSLTASQLQVQYTFVSFSLLPLAFFLAGSILTKRDVLITQTAFALLYFVFSGPLSHLFYTESLPGGYILGSIPAGWIVARVRETDRPSYGWQIFILAGILVSLCAFFFIKDQVSIYQKYTMALALALALVYYLRLRHRIHVLIIYTSALIIYYVCGLAGLFLNRVASPLDSIFRGYFLLLPGDLFTLILSVYLIYPLAEKLREKFADYYAVA